MGGRLQDRNVSSANRHSQAGRLFPLQSRARRCLRSGFGRRGQRKPWGRRRFPCLPISHASRGEPGWRMSGLPGDEHVIGWPMSCGTCLPGCKRAGSRPPAVPATVVMLTIKDNQLLALQIGDSALVARRAGIWEAICWPENSEIASWTYFVTDDPAVRLRTARLPLDYDAFALFSDGIGSRRPGTCDRSALTPAFLIR